MTRFSTDTAVDRIGDGVYAATIDHGWWIERGPNGGYLAAIVLRAVLAEAADADRRPRSMTLHYLRPPVVGACEVEVVTERAGRGLSTLTARLRQDGRDCVLALVALAVDRPGPALHHHPAPDVPAANDVPPRPPETTTDLDIPFRHRFELRPTIGNLPFASGTEALTGGWIRTADDDPVDEVLLAAITDAWPPAIFATLEQRLGVPTIELTVHFRNAPDRAPGWCLVRFRTLEASEGYLEESGEVWSADGRLLAESRQLGVLLPPG